MLPIGLEMRADYLGHKFTAKVTERGFDREAAGRMLAEHRAGARDHSAALWPLLAFGLWLDRLRG